MFQSVTECCRVLQSITEYYRVLQSVSGASTWTNFWACFTWSSPELRIYYTCVFQRQWDRLYNGGAISTGSVQWLCSVPPPPPSLATCTIQHCNILDNIKMVAVARADRHLLTTDEQPSLLSLITTLKSFSLRLLIHFSPYFSSQFVLAKNCNRLCQRRGTF